MKHLVAALPIALALLIPSAAFAEGGKSVAKTHAAHTHAAKAPKKAAKAPKKAALKAHKAPHTSKKTAAK